MTRFLIVTWDGAGNLLRPSGSPAPWSSGATTSACSGTTRSRTLRRRGRPFVPYAARGLGRHGGPRRLRGRGQAMMEALCFSPAIATTWRELDREPADVVLVDCMLFTAIDAARPRASRPRRSFTRRTRSSAAVRSSRCSRRACVRTGIVRAWTGHRRAARRRTRRCASRSWRCRTSSSPVYADAANVLRIGPVLDAPPLYVAPTTSTSDDGSARWSWSA